MLENFFFSVQFSIPRMLCIYISLGTVIFSTSTFVFSLLFFIIIIFFTVECCHLCFCTVSSYNLIVDHFYLPFMSSASPKTNGSTNEIDRDTETHRCYFENCFLGGFVSDDGVNSPANVYNEHFQKCNF